MNPITSHNFVLDLSKDFTITIDSLFIWTSFNIAFTQLKSNLIKIKKKNLKLYLNSS